MANANANVSKLSPMERAMLFQQMTRKHWQMMASKTGGEGETISFEIPKTRLLSKIGILVTTTITATHASKTEFVPADFAPFSLLSNIKVEVNNGFAPHNVSGVGAYLKNLLSLGGKTIEPLLDSQTVVNGSRKQNKMGLTASSSGTVNTVQFYLELPIAVNDRDAVGLILTQNQETVVTLNCSIGNANSIAPTATGFTFDLGDVTIAPIAETYSVPAVQEALPDLSMLLLNHEQTFTVAGQGQQILKLPTGLTYRKLAFLISDTSGGEADGDIQGNIELRFNQADTPININPKILASINERQYGFPLPKGLFVLDFTYQGLPNYGGMRDYIDTERLTEFWLVFNSAGAGSVRVISEQLAKLKM